MKGSWVWSVVPLLLMSALGASAAVFEQLDERDPYFERASNTRVGGKGDDTIDVSRDPCVGEPLAFHRAEIVILDSRFGDAQFVQLPVQGCFFCDPVIVRWYHEPTGRLHYKVRVYRRPMAVDCPVEVPL